MGGVQREGGVGKPPPLEGVLALTVVPLALRSCNRAIADDKDPSKNPMKFPVTSLFKNDSRGRLLGPDLGCEEKTGC